MFGWYRFINLSEEPEEHFASIHSVDVNANRMLLMAMMDIISSLH